MPTLGPETLRSFQFKDKEFIFIGSQEHTGVNALRRQLEAWGGKISNDSSAQSVDASLGRDVSVVVLCFTGGDIGDSGWSLISASLHSRVKLLPVVFPGGELPAIIAGVRPAKMEDSIRGMNALGAALERFLN